MKYWHFLPDNGCLRYGSNEKVKLRHTLMHPSDFKPILCTQGFHASKKAIDALKYAPGALVCLVTLHGKIVHGDDKSVAQGRTVIAMADATNVLHEMACRFAEQLLTLIPNPDPRSIAAIAAKRAWVKGEISDDDLTAKRDSARVITWEDKSYFKTYAAVDAAYSRAWDSARNAAWCLRFAGEVVIDSQNTMLESMLHELLGTKGEE